VDEWQEIELLVPIAKMIQHDRYRYAAFDKFPLGIKVFINSIIVFVDAVNVYKQYPLLLLPPAFPASAAVYSHLSLARVDAVAMWN
jgi:hypothetical protein